MHRVYISFLYVWMYVCFDYECVMCMHVCIVCAYVLCMYIYFLIYGTYRQNIYSSEYVCILNYAYEIELILNEID